MLTFCGYNSLYKAATDFLYVSTVAIIGFPSLSEYFRRRKIRNLSANILRLKHEKFFRIYHDY